MKTIKALVVEDQPIYRKGIVKILSALEFVEICDEASNGQVALDKFQQKVYDVVFMDIEMEVMNGVIASRLIKEKYPKAIIIILTLHDTKRLIAELFEMG
jgi:DNA-binding NarL/FixJ family response regulator